MPKTVKVMFGVPTEGHTQAEALQSIRRMTFHHGVLQGQSQGKDVVFEFHDSTVGRMFTPMAREVLAQRALAAECDYIFMIDDDMLAPYDTFDRLYRHNVDVCAALAFTRNHPYLAVLYSTKEGWDERVKRKFVQTEWIRNWPRGKLVECDAVGFGAVLIKTEVLKKMQPPYFMCSSGNGEDIWFCVRAKQEASAKIFMDTTFELGHMSSPVIVDSALHEKANDPQEQELLYGPYNKHKVFDVAHLPKPIDVSEPEVVAL